MIQRWVVHHVVQDQAQRGICVVIVLDYPAGLGLEAEALLQQDLQHLGLLHRREHGAHHPLPAAQPPSRHRRQPPQDADWTEGDGYRWVRAVPVSTHQ